MMMTTKSALLATALSMIAVSADAGCGIAAGDVRILSNDFEALHILATKAEECAGDGVTVSKNQTAEHKNIQVPALTANPAEYTVAVVANGSIGPLLSAGLIRPLDDLVAKHGQILDERQLIKIDGKIMAIAFMMNTQHLIYRKDLIEKAGLQPPKTYEDFLTAAQALRDQGLMENPLGANLKPGWDLAEEFVNMYTGFGGEFFEAGGAKPAIANETGVKALEMLKSLSGFMGPDYLTYDTNGLKAEWEAGRVGIMNQWGSRAGAIADVNGPAPEIAKATVLAAAPTVGGGTIPAATLWWDGFTIAQNVSDEDAEASFQAMMHALDPATATEHPDAAAWLIRGYEPAPAVVGVFETAAAGARPYPMMPYMGLLHTALGNELAEFMQGKEDAMKALEDASAAYVTAATEAGFLK